MKFLLILASFAIVVLFLVILATFLERYWRQHQAEQSAKPKASAPIDINRWTRNIVNWAEQLRSTVLGGESLPDEQMVERFRAWVTHDLNNERDLQSWLLTLPKPGVVLLVKHIAAFCQELNFDLQWLLEQQVTIAPELRVAMQAAIVDYCRACQRAVPVQKQAKLFTQYQKLVKNPNNKAEQALSNTLYANLTAQGLAPAPSAAFIAATEEERRQQTLQAIQQVAAQDWSHFAQVFHATLTPNGTPLSPRNGQHSSDSPTSANGVAIESKKPAERAK